MNAPAANAVWYHLDEQEEFFDLLNNRRLYAVFQPIIDFRLHAFIGYEGLIRGPAGGSLRTPDDLFTLARGLGMEAEFEVACREIVIRSFARLGRSGQLFINVSPRSLVETMLRGPGLLDLLREVDLAPGRVVIELTENQAVTDLPEIHEALAACRAQGFRVAIDDLGEGFANLRMWSEVRPEFVKIDRHFVHGIAEDRLKFHFVKAMQELAEACSSHLVAEGIEREEDFRTIRDLGIACGQGFFIERPVPLPGRRPRNEVMNSLENGLVSVFPQGPLVGKPTTALALLREVIPVTPATPNEEVVARFEADLSLESLPVVADGTPVGLIGRQTMLNHFASPFGRELYGRRPCAAMMNPVPLVVDQHATLQDLGLLLARVERHHLYDGFIIVGEHGYLGTGSGHRLMGLITELQVCAARYANPLTQLPGNVPINEHVDRLVSAGREFVVCYADIDRFKPYNDTYGYRKGDDVVLMLAKVLEESVDSRLDFLGHIGGDDFIILFQSEDWARRCEEILRRFDARIQPLCRPEHREEGGFVCANRARENVFYALPSLSLGVLPVGVDSFESHRDVAIAATDAKRQAKKMPGSSLFIERRRFVRETLKQA